MPAARGVGQRSTSRAPPQSWNRSRPWCGGRGLATGGIRCAASLSGRAFTSWCNAAASAGDNVSTVDASQLTIPVILGTPRQGRLSEHVARIMIEQLCKRRDVATTLIDVRTLYLSSMDAGEAIKDAAFSEAMLRADGLVIVVPEYNHGYPGILKHVLDTNLKEYIHKPVGLCGVSAGGFGGTRVVESLLPVMRELGLVSIFWDVNVSSVGKAFDESGKLLDQALPRRIDKMLSELVWMARVLRYGRDNVSTSDASANLPMMCTACGLPMNQHAQKVDFSSPTTAHPVFYGTLQQIHQCAGCGNVQVRLADAS
ncbi:MAG: NAD(P)H-dependent oxidoreductase [Chloroflexi bacterium]|nr:NAD(P)H-dependent oxidoreductase [Chloroflexota bacterium]